MLKLPNRDLKKESSIQDLNIDLLCDWVEATALFDEEKISRNDIADHLCEEKLCDNLSSAQDVLLSMWEEFKRRQTLCSRAYGLELDRDWIKRKNEWSNYTAHSFCILLALVTGYDWWSEHVEEYNEQGELFEKLAEDALSSLTPNWKTLRTGWSRTNASGFKKIARIVAEKVTGGESSLNDWETKGAKEKGLDLLTYMHFADEREGAPYFMIQCASGRNWSTKTSDPNLDVWQDILRPATKPMRGFAIPFCFSDNSEFRRLCVAVSGLVLDRCRILGSIAMERNDTKDAISTEIQTWIESHLNFLLKESAD